MAALVFLHVAFSLEALAAERTHEWHFLGVDLHVAQKTSLVEEALATLCAHVWPFFLMNTLVCSKSCSVGKALSTVAGMDSFLLVSLEMPVEVAGTAETQITARTFVRIL